MLSMALVVLSKLLAFVCVHHASVPISSSTLSPSCVIHRNFAEPYVHTRICLAYVIRVPLEIFQLCTCIPISAGVGPWFGHPNILYRDRRGSLCLGPLSKPIVAGQLLVGPTNNFYLYAGICPPTCHVLFPMPRWHLLGFGPLNAYPGSFAMAMSPSVSADPFRVAYNSLSAELGAINDWVFDQPLIRCLPTWMQPPVVDFLASLSPAKPASV